jgi:hypothetical protein
MPQRGFSRRTRIFAGLVGLLSVAFFATAVWKAVDMHHPKLPGRGKNLLAATIQVPSQIADRNPAEVRDFLKSKLEGIPGVERASAVSPLPFAAPQKLVLAESLAAKRFALVSVRMADADAFEILGLRVVEGRDFMDADVLVPGRTAILNTTAARELFPREPAAGRRIRIESDPEGLERVIVGVIEDLPENVPEVYLPGLPRFRTEVTVVLKVTSTGPEMQSRLRSGVPEFGCGGSVVDLAAFDELAARNLRQRLLLYSRMDTLEEPRIPADARN